jgi:mannose-6-phosphate isomerase
MHLTPHRHFQHKVAMPRRLKTLVVEKPWGRTDIPSAFGNLDGRRIGEIWFAHPDGDDVASTMIKFLFTSERLSIQVHPDDAIARRAGFASGKDECWLVLDADDGAELGVGLIAPAELRELRDAALDGSIVDRIDWRSAHTHDFVYNPAGTIHAIGGGLVIVEVQQNIDCTYRLYDYGRPRALHLDEGLAVADRKPVADPHDVRIDPAESRALVNGPHFHVTHLAGPITDEIRLGDGDEMTFLPLSDGCRVARETLKLGEAVLLEGPAMIDIAAGARALLVCS